MSNDNEKVRKESAGNTGDGYSAEEVVRAVARAQPNGRSLVAQLVAILCSLGLVGGGGYIGLDVIKTELAHTNSQVTAIVQSVEQIKPLLSDVRHLQRQVTEMRADLKGITQVRIELLEKIEEHEDGADRRISELRDRVSRLEAFIEALKKKE